MSREEAMRALLQDTIMPEKYAGEGQFSTEEYFPQDIRDPYVLGDVMEEEGYYPRPMQPPKKWPPARRY